MLYDNDEGLFVNALVAVGISGEPLIIRMDDNFKQLIVDFPLYDSDIFLDEYGESIPKEIGFYNCKFKVESEDRYHSGLEPITDLIFYVEYYKRLEI